MSRRVEDLTDEQRSKLAHLSLVTGIEDHQELLDKVPQMAEGIVEDFKPVIEAIVVVWENIVGVWKDLPPETLAEIKKLMDRH